MVVYKKNRPRTNKWSFALYIGFSAGLVWGGLKLIESYFHFTTLTPGFMLEPFFLHSFLLTWPGLLLGWAVFTLFSILASLLYAAFWAKVPGPRNGLAYGLAWWAIIFLLIGPPTGMMPWIGYIDGNTLMTDICLYMLWGLFIGYSISFEFNDERSREPYMRKRFRRAKTNG